MERKTFLYDAPVKNTPLWIFVSYKPPKGGQAGVSLDFDQVWIRKIYAKFGALFKICTTLLKFCSYAPHY